MKHLEWRCKHWTKRRIKTNAVTRCRECVFRKIPYHSHHYSTCFSFILCVFRCLVFFVVFFCVFFLFLSITFSHILTYIFSQKRIHRYVCVCTRIFSIYKYYFCFKIFPFRLFGISIYNVYKSRNLLVRMCIFACVILHVDGPVRLYALCVKCTHTVTHSARSCARAHALARSPARRMRKM